MTLHSSLSTAPTGRPLLGGDESPLNDLDESAHETELPEQDELIEAIEQLDEPMPMVSDPSQP